MADAIWPSALPAAPVLSSVEEQPPDLTIRSSMDTGPAKVRRRATAGVTAFPGLVLKCTRTQVALLESFFYTTLKAGALTFEWKHPRSGDTRDFRFVGPPSFRPNQPRSDSEQERYTVTMNLEMLPAIPQGDDGGGPEVCQLMFGATGSTVWGTDSSLSVTIGTACLGASLFYNKTTTSVTFTYEGVTLDGSGQLRTVTWIHESPTGTISRITFDRDSGWSFDINPAHLPDAVCGADTQVGPDTGSEDGVFVRNKSLPEADNAVANKWCPQATNDWFKTLDVTVNPGSCPVNPARATGFRAYAALCGIDPGTGIITHGVSQNLQDLSTLREIAET